jgi:Spy/CpxP family protein refolding chaperone
MEQRQMKRLALLGAAALGAAAMAIAWVVAPSVSAAQTQQPYAGLQTRPIKALSGPQIADLKEGRGMGLALAAELNGYPGPLHVLEHADTLQLSDAQRKTVRQLFDAMKAETVPIGLKLIAQETELDRQFASRTATDASVTAATQAIGATQATLRAAHLRYHLATIIVLTPAQTLRYGELRGYASGAAGEHQHGEHWH